MIATFESALSHGPNSAVLAIYGDYALRVLHKPESALGMWRETVAMEPRIAQYRVNLIRLLIAMGYREEARGQVRDLRAMGRLGQYEAVADEMDARLQVPVRATPTSQPR
jgi:hypothetical protein